MCMMIATDAFMSPKAPMTKISDCVPPLRLTSMPIHPMLDCTIVTCCIITLPIDRRLVSPDERHDSSTIVPVSFLHSYKHTRLHFLPCRLSHKSHMQNPPAHHRMCFSFQICRHSAINIALQTLIFLSLPIAFLSICFREIH